MSLLRKSLDAVTIADLNAIIEAGARETSELEFKGTLPFQPTKNQPEKADRWIEKGDRVGDYARDENSHSVPHFIRRFSAGHPAR